MSARSTARGRRSGLGAQPEEIASSPHVAFPLDRTFEFLRALWRLNHALESTSQNMLKELGVTAQQRTILRIVGKFPGVSAGALADLLHVDAGTLSAALKRLEKRGLVERRRSPNDARRVWLGLTSAGRALDAPTAGTVESAVERTLSRLVPREHRAAGRALALLVEELERASRQPSIAAPQKRRAAPSRPSPRR